MHEGPGVVGRVVAFFRGEVPAETVEAYQRAGRVVDDLDERLESLRLAAMVQHGHPLAFPRAVQTALLCGWNARALQDLGNGLLHADYEHDPRTVGYLEPRIAEHAMAFYGQVPRWLSRAEQALHNPGYELDTTVPVPLPDLPEPNGDDGVVAVALLDVLDRLRVRVEGRVTDDAVHQERAHEHRASGGGHGHSRPREAVQRTRQLLADASVSADFARGLRGTAEDDGVVVEVMSHVRAGLERIYAAGQFAAMPELAFAKLPRAVTAARSGARARVLPAPGHPDFDPWCLTDARARKELRGESESRRLINLLWSHDPDPVRTLALKAQIDAAVLRGDLAIEAGHYHGCPWAPIYLVKRPVKLGSRTFHPLEQLTLEVGREVGWNRRVKFVRRVVTGPFFPRDDGPRWPK